MLYEVRVQINGNNTVKAKIKYGVKPHRNCPDITFVHERNFVGIIEVPFCVYEVGEDEYVQPFHIDEIDEFCRFANNGYWDPKEHELVLSGNYLEVGKNYITCVVSKESEDYNPLFDEDGCVASIAIDDLQEV